jgi:hypothetical protein
MAQWHGRESRAERRPPAGPWWTCQPRLERLETRCLPGFLAPLAFDAGSSPYSVAVADFNGDGKPDLAVANLGTYPNYSDSSVSVLLGKGDGTFLPAINYAAGSAPHSVAVGDFNGDGHQDLAVVAGGGVSILLGKGDGTFLPAVNYTVGYLPLSVAVGDFNGDGIPDLAVANSNIPNPGTVSVLLGKGDGTFLPTLTFPVGNNPLSVAVGDFNGDGHQDLAVANYYSNNVSVLLGQGDGTFQSAVNYAAGYIPNSVAVGDFNGDGFADLAVASNSGVSVLPGQGDGTFLPAQSFYAGIYPSSVAVADFNGDGKPDLAVANYGFYGQGSSVSVLLGKGDGTFQPPVYYPAGGESASVAVGDFKGDGKQDLAVANSYPSNTVSVLLGKGDGTFQTAPSFPAGSSPRSVAVGDFNGDGIQDLAVANNTYSGTVSVLLGQGDGTFLPAQSFPAGSSPRSVAVGDFNGDGKLDLAVANQGTSFPYYDDSSVSILLGQGDGTFLPALSFSAGAGRRSVAVGDFNGDGKLDLVAAGYGLKYAPISYIPYDEDVRVLLGNGDGTFQPAQSYPAGSVPWSVAVGDFNGDGKPDLAVANQISSTVSILLGQGDGTFQPAVNYAAGTLPRSVAVGDFNGDGKQDLAVVFGGGVRVLLGKGDGTFQTTSVSYVAGSVPISVAVRDFNGDGFPDLAVANGGSNDVSILLNDATWAGGPSRARGGPSHRLVPQPLPRPAVPHPLAGEEPPWADTALLAGTPPPGHRPVLAAPAPLALPGADPPGPMILDALLWEGKPSVLAGPRAGLGTRGAPGGALDRLFAELAASGIWDDRTDDGMPPLA